MSEKRPPTVFEWLKSQERFAKWQLRSVRKRIEQGTGFTEDQMEALYDQEFLFINYLNMLETQREHLHERYPTHPHRGASRRR